MGCKRAGTPALWRHAPSSAGPHRCLTLRREDGGVPSLRREPQGGGCARGRCVRSASRSVGWVTPRPRHSAMACRFATTQHHTQNRAQCLDQSPQAITIRGETGSSSYECSQSWRAQTNNCQDHQPTNMRSSQLGIKVPVNASMRDPGQQSCSTRNFHLLPL